MPSNLGLPDLRPRNQKTPPCVSICIREASYSVDALFTFARRFEGLLVERWTPQYQWVTFRSREGAKACFDALYEIGCQPSMIVVSTMLYSSSVLPCLTATQGLCQLPNKFCGPPEHITCESKSINVGE